MKKLICWLFGHKMFPDLNGVVMECLRCDKQEEMTIETKPSKTRSFKSVRYGTLKKDERT